MLTWGDFEAPKQLAGNNIEEQIKDLKESDGNIIIFGSPTLVRSLTDASLIDEYHFQVHPVVVTEGDQLFDGLKTRKDFELVSVESLGEGSIAVSYKPVKHAAFAGPIIVTTRGFLAKSDKTAQEVDAMHAAWTKAVILSVTLWSRAYVDDGSW